MSGRCDGCGEIGYVWCGECNAPHPEDAVATREKLRAENERLLTLLARAASYLDYMEERGYSSVRVIRSDVHQALREAGRNYVPVVEA